MTKTAHFNSAAIDAAVADALAVAPAVTVKANKIPKGTYYPNMASIGARIYRKTYRKGTDGFSMEYPKLDLDSKFVFHKCIGHY